MPLIELIKKEELNGETWYHIRIDGLTDQSSKDELVIKNKYNEMVERNKTGLYPIVTILESTNV